MYLPRSEELYDNKLQHKHDKLLQTASEHVVMAINMTPAGKLMPWHYERFTARGYLRARHSTHFYKRSCLIRI